MKRERGYGFSVDGFTLFEVLVAMLMLGMVSMMIYSVLNVSIKMSDKGEKAIYKAARQYGIMRLLHDQVISAYYDSIARKVRISGQDEILRLVTRAPLRYRNDGVVMAIYRYDRRSETLYYLEKRDYFNTEYDEDFVPDIDEMMVLSTGVAPIAFTVEEESQAVSVSYDEKSYALLPKCTNVFAVGVVENSP